MMPSLQLTSIQLRVHDLGRSVEFYTQKLGFVVTRQSDTEAELATSPESAPILTLAENGAARQPPPDAAGLFHAAILLPTRAALGAWLQFAAEQSVDFEGFSDHGVSEAIYLSDPDGNGLEFYADRPQDQWPFADGELAMVTRPLAVRSLLIEAASDGSPPLNGATWGHLHLRVIDLDRSEAFYRRTLGVEVMQRSFPGARFLAADRYHHHLGLNTWGRPRLAQPASALGLAEATFARSGVSGFETVVDPNGIHLRVESLLVPA